MKYIDLSHKITTAIPVYPGDPTVEIQSNNLVENNGFTSHTITIGTHVGTHIDAPWHMLIGGKRISDYQIDHFMGKALIIDAQNQSKIDAHLLNNHDLSQYSVILIYTGRDKIYNQSEYFTVYPEVTTDFAQKLVDAKIKIVGMDQASPDYEPFNTHKLLLQNDILIIENLTNLDQLINQDNITITALPLNTETEASPVRVIAAIN